MPNLWHQFGIEENDIEGIETVLSNTLERSPEFETLLRGRGEGLTLLGDGVSPLVPAILAAVCPIADLHRNSF